MQSVAISNPTLLQDVFACWWLASGVTWDTVPEQIWLLKLLQPPNLFPTSTTTPPDQQPVQDQPNAQQHIADVAQKLVHADLHSCPCLQVAGMTAMMCHQKVTQTDTQASHEHSVVYKVSGTSDRDQSTFKSAGICFFNISDS